MTGATLGEVLDWWEIVGSPRRRCANGCARWIGVDPDDVIMSPEQRGRDEA